MGFLTPGRSLRRPRRPERAAPAAHKRRRAQRVDLLELLPPDVLLHIFTLVDLRRNQLHLTCKYFHRLFTPASLGDYYTGRLVAYQFVHDLNRLVAPLVPYVRKLLNTLDAKRIGGSVTRAVSAAFGRMLRQGTALDISVFGFGFVGPGNASRYANCLVASVEDIEVEARKRLEFVKSQVRRLHRELDEYRRRHDPETALDDLSRLAEAIFNGADAEPQESYDFSLPPPAFAPKYASICSLEQLSRVEFLNRQFGFVFADLNPVVANIVDSKLPVRFKSLALELVLKIGSSDLAPLTVKRVLRVAVATDDQAFLSTVNSVLEAFYSAASDDQILWDFVIHHENLTLLEIMNRFSSPAI